MTNKKTKNTETAVRVITPKQESASVETFISQAIAASLPVETMEKLFALREKVKAEQAREAFTQALSEFQGQCPVIEKKKKVMNKDGQTIRYKYAPMESVIEQIKKPLASNGFSFRWDVERAEQHMKVTCKLTHRLGHSETSTFEIPIVESQFMTSPQSYATAQSYAKRYTLLNVLGIGTADEDTDATDTGRDKDAKSLKAKIVLRLRALKEKTATKEDIEKAVKMLTSLDLLEDNYEEIASRLQQVIDEKNEA